MLASKNEYECHTTEISPDEMAVVANVRAEAGAQVVVYLETLGRFSGTVARQTPMGFEMIMRLPPMKREKLAAQLAWFAGHDVMGLPEKRSQERIVPLAQLTMMRLPYGGEHIVKINDISCDGANIETDRQPPVGAQILLGSTPAVVLRHFDHGLACQFITPFDVGSLNMAMRL